MDESSKSSRFQSSLAIGAVALGLIVWLWPIGFGGQMPVGGDVTQFSLGLMAFLAKAYETGRLPAWNSLWGFGFPGLAESQMGVFYPPHGVLYRFLSLERAYTASLVLHTLWGGFGAYWAARRFQASPAGSALAGFAWGASGFFVIHIPHQWAYTVGSWMPWAIGLSWILGTQASPRRAWLFLVLVFSLQVLPGHFQLAFCTQVAAILLALGGLDRERASLRRLVLVLLAIAATLPLAALQLWPTFRLAQLAEARRDFEYLSGFAVSPLHLVSYLAPRLFHLSPLWRPLAWDPFHTSPEEYLGYVGLIPFFLAIKTILTGARRDTVVRALAVLVLGTLFFSLGPYSPGFKLWIRLPGFSFFRGPARWTLATELGLCLLAARGFDACRSWNRPGLSLARFSVVAALLIGGIVLSVELALASSERQGWPAVESLYQSGLNLLPWSGGGNSTLANDGAERRPPPAPEPSFRELMVMARQPQNDARIPTALARQGERVGRTSDWRFASRRVSIYHQELAATGAILVGLVVLSFFAHRERLFLAGMLVFSLGDLWLLGHQRPFDLGPIRPLATQSPVLAKLAKEAGQKRSVDPLRNLPMVVGAGPVSAYRTLDLPILTGLTEWIQRPVGAGANDAQIHAGLRAVGAAIRVLDPSYTALAMTGASPIPGWQQRATIVDPVLAGWLSGVDWVKQQGARAATFTTWRPAEEPAEAWLVSQTSTPLESMLGLSSGDPARVLKTLEPAKPLRLQRSRPEHLTLDLAVTEKSVVIVSQLSDPQWMGQWVNASGRVPATIHPVFRQGSAFGWQAIETPGPGRWTLEMTYDARDVRQGLAVTMVAGALWTLGFVGTGRRKAPIENGKP